MAEQPLPLAEGPILVALDGPRHARAALRVVRRLCAQVDRSVIVVQAALPALSTQGVLEHLGVSPEDLAGFVVEPLNGVPDRVLPAFARERGCSLVVIGLNPGRSEPGPVTQSLLTRAPCPVLFVPPSVREGWGEGGIVLLPLDGTPSTSMVAPLAISMADRTGSDLEILYVGGAFAPSEPGSMALPSFIDQPQYEWAMWKREFLYRFCDCHWGGKLPVEVRLFLETGEPAEAILACAERQGPDLIVVGWHGELKRAHAKTLRRLLQYARWPLMTARV